MPRRNLHAIPTAVALLTPATVLITYVMAIELHDVPAIFPYVSVTGTVGVESYVFSFLLNITAFLLAACVYARHLFVRKFARFRLPKGFYLNRMATYVGLASCLGLDMVANFQVSKCPPVHYVGAGLCFLGSIVYFYMQTVLSRHMAEDLEPRNLFYLRILLTFLAFSFLTITIVGGALAKIEFTGQSQRQWRPIDGGFGYHVMSAAAEWMTIFTQAALVLTFLPAFKCIAIKPPRIVIDELYTSSFVQLETVSSSIITG